MLHSISATETVTSQILVYLSLMGWEVHQWTVRVHSLYYIQMRIENQTQETRREGICNCVTVMLWSTQLLVQCISTHCWLWTDRLWMLTRPSSWSDWALGSSSPAHCHSTHSDIVSRWVWFHDYRPWCCAWQSAVQCIDCFPIMLLPTTPAAWVRMVQWSITKDALRSMVQAELLKTRGQNWSWGQYFSIGHGLVTSGLGLRLLALASNF